MLPKFYQTYFKKRLKLADYLTLNIVINVLQSIKQVNLERLATALPIPILFESRRRKMQRFLSLPQWDVETIWLPLIREWVEKHIKPESCVYFAIDRTRWQVINVLVISLIWNRRAIPLYFELLPKQGNSNLEEQTTALLKVLPGFKQYHIWVSFWYICTDLVSQLMLLNCNKLRFYQRGQRALTLIQSLF